MTFQPRDRFLHLVLPGLLFAVLLYLSSNLPSLWFLAPISIAGWAMLALSPAPLARPALATLFAASWIFYGFGQRFFIVWGVPAWLAATVYQAALTILPALALRSASWKFPRLTPVLTVPVAWIAGEYLRTLGPFGLPTGSLALPLSETPILMQTADLGGTFAVSLPLAVSAGWLVECLQKFRAGPAARSAFLPSTILTAAVWSMAIGYGAFRLQEGKQTMIAGPRIALVQTDAPTDLRVAPISARQLSAEVMAETKAIDSQRRNRAEEAPALIVWPESPGFPPLTREFLTANPTTEALRTWNLTPQDFADDRALVPSFAHAVRSLGGASLLYGCPSPEPDAAAPGGWRTFNAAVLWLPTGAPDSQRQDKVHPIAFGEYLPGIPYGAIPPAVHRWLPEVQNLSAGQRRILFSVPAAVRPNGSPYRFAVIFCNEGMLATLAGVFHSDPATIRGADFLVVMANEAGFQRGELPWHAARVCAYRAIEARVGIARAANTGISGFYRPDGAFYGAVRNPAGQVQTGKGFPERALLRQAARILAESNGAPDTAAQAQLESLQQQIAAARDAAGVRGSSVEAIVTDSRAHSTFYARWGDWLGAIFLALAFLGGVWPAPKNKSD